MQSDPLCNRGRRINIDSVQSALRGSTAVSHDHVVFLNTGCNSFQ